MWLRRYGIDGAYVPLAVRPEHLAQALAALPKLGFRGVNVTVPHKEQALSLVHQASPAALRASAPSTPSWWRPTARLPAATPGLRPAFSEGACARSARRFAPLAEAPW